MKYYDYSTSSTQPIQPVENTKLEEIVNVSILDKKKLNQSHIADDLSQPYK